MYHNHSVHIMVSCTINNNIFNVLAQVILIPSPVFFFDGSYTDNISTILG